MELYFPLITGPNADGHTYTTSALIRNAGPLTAECAFSIRNRVAREVIEPGTRLFPDVLPAATETATVRVDCTSEIEILSRIQQSSSQVRTAGAERFYHAVSVARSGTTAVVRVGTPSIAIGEVRGETVTVRLTTRHAQAITFPLGPHDVRLVDIDRPNDLPTEVEIEIVGGNGQIFASAEAASGKVVPPVPVRRATTSTTTTPETLLGVASFKAAPFRDPATGLVYMRDRWFDPRSGTFLTPDPAGYRDSSNLYSYCSGDPVNCHDPTGRDAVSRQGVFVGADAGGRLRRIDYRRLFNGSVRDLYERLAADNIPLHLRDLIVERVTGSSQGTAIVDELAPQTAARLDAYTRGYLSSTLSIAPSIGDLKDAQEALTGEDLLLKEKLSPAARITTVVAAGIPFVGGAVVRHVGRPLIDPAQRAFHASATADAHHLIPSSPPVDGEIYVIGRLPDTSVARSWPGHRVLNIAEWTLEKNDAWIAQAIQERRTFYLASPVEGQVTHELYGLSVYGRELAMLMNAGYRRVGDYLVPPGM
jgi:RHS repeat-associated protein